MRRELAAVFAVLVACVLWTVTAAADRSAPTSPFEVVGGNPDNATAVHLAYADTQTFRMFVKNQGATKSAQGKVRWSSWLKSGGTATPLATADVVFPALDPQQTVSVDYFFSLASAAAAAHTTISGASDVELSATLLDGVILSKAQGPKGRTWAIKVDAPAPDLELASPSPLPASPLHFAYDESKTFSVVVHNGGAGASIPTLLDWTAELAGSGNPTIGVETLQVPALAPNESRSFTFAFNCKNLMTASKLGQLKSMTTVNVSVALRDTHQSKNATVVPRITWTPKVDAPTSWPNVVIASVTPSTGVEISVKYGVAKTFTATFKNEGNLKSNAVKIYWAAYADKSYGTFSFADSLVTVPALNPGATFTSTFQNGFTAPILKDPSATGCVVRVSFVDSSQSSDGNAAQEGKRWNGKIVH